MAEVKVEDNMFAGTVTANRQKHEELKKTMAETEALGAMLLSVTLDHTSARSRRVAITFARALNIHKQ